MANRDTQVAQHLDDIQGWLLSGYKRLEHARYLFCRLNEARGARELIGKLAGESTTAAKWFDRSERPRTALNVCFTCRGLKSLGLPHPSLLNFSTEFQQDMYPLHRSRQLGDVDGSQPDRWEIGGPRQEFDVLIILHAVTEHELNEYDQKKRAQLAANGVTCGHVETGHRLKTVENGQEYFHEHFGFRDGISQPEIEGSGKRRATGQTVLKAGEFVLGYRDEYGYFPPTPLLRREYDEQVILPDSQVPGWRDLGRNGTYVVFRKLEQDVPAFWSFMQRNARNEKDKLLVASKCVGRWPNGAPVTLSPEGPDPELTTPERINSFKYLPQDPHGYRCPVSSHIRRANPRDALDAVVSETMSRRHQIIRRGIPYGPPWSEGGADEHADRGLLFFAINADIRRQFELQQAQWIENPTFNNLSDAKDPLLGAHDDTGHVVLDGMPVRRRFGSVPRFVHVRGGAYLFLPGIRALRALAALKT